MRTRHRRVGAPVRTTSRRLCSFAGKPAFHKDKAGGKMRSDEEILDALVTHNAELKNLHAEILACQAIIACLFQHLDRPMAEDVLERAAQAAMIATEISGSAQTTKCIQITDQLRTSWFGRPIAAA
jgi:hypothetical protein